MELARRHPGRIAALVLVSPTTDHFAVFIRILRLAEQDLASEQPDVASALGTSLARTRSLMDHAMREALQHALHDPVLFTHYWADPAQFQASIAAWAKPEAQFDPESFFAVLADFAQVAHAREPVSVPALLVFGGRDPIAPVADVAEGVLETLPGARVEVFEDGGHFVHLDRPDRFVETVMEWAGGCVQAPN